MRSRLKKRFETKLKNVLSKLKCFDCIAFFKAEVSFSKWKPTYYTMASLFFILVIIKKGENRYLSLIDTMWNLKSYHFNLFWDKNVVHMPKIVISCYKIIRTFPRLFIKFCTIFIFAGVSNLITTLKSLHFWKTSCFAKKITSNIF